MRARERRSFFTPGPEEMKDTFSRILILNQNWLGDVLFSTPAIRALRQRYPQAHITCLAPRRVAEVLSHNPNLNEVLVYNERAMLVTLFEPLRILWMMRCRRFEAVFFFHRSRSKAFLAWLAGIPVRVGFSREGRGWLLTHPVAMPRGSLHKTDLFLYLLATLGISSAGRWPEMEATREEEKALNDLLLTEGISKEQSFVVLHVGGNWDLKRWPIEYFIRWTRLFLESRDWKVVLCGSAGEERLARQVLQAFPGGKVVSLCGRTKLGELAALMKRAKMVLSNDSGPIHVAASQRARTLGLFGPTSPMETGPISEGPLRVLWKDVGCQVPCYFRACNGRACMNFLTPEEVFERTQELLAL